LFDRVSEFLYIPLAAVQTLVQVSCFFFNNYFVFEPRNSVFHLFQSVGVALNYFFFLLTELFVSMVSVWIIFFYSFHIFVKLLFCILYCLLYFISLFVLTSLVSFQSCWNLLLWVHFVVSAYYLKFLIHVLLEFIELFCMSSLSS
jgi:hypothetical protein